jgi:transcriptional regulator with XRE-family HTH domain
MTRVRPLSTRAGEAARLLGLQIRAARIERRWTVDELATRAGVSHVTISKLERGDPSVKLGTALEAAVLVGIPLFGNDRERRAETGRTRGRLGLLPKAARPTRSTIDDDF